MIKIVWLVLAIGIVSTSVMAQIVTPPSFGHVPKLGGSGISIWIAPIIIPPVKKVTPIKMKKQDPSKKIYYIDGKCYKKAKYVSDSKRNDDDLVKVSCP